MTTPADDRIASDEEVAKAREILAKAEAAESRYRKLSGGWRVLLITLTALALLLALNQLLNLQLIGRPILSNSYLYALCALLTGGAFLIMPATAGAPRDRVPW